MSNHWTDKVQLNRPFVDSIRSLSGSDGFYAMDAFWLYSDDHWRAPVSKRREYPLGDRIMQNNARNQLYKMEHLGILQKMAPGRYLLVEGA